MKKSVSLLAIAASAFVAELAERGLLERTDRVGVQLYGSLALTGRGHCTDRAACSRALDRGADPADCGFCGNRAAFADLSHPHAA